MWVDSTAYCAAERPAAGDANGSSSRCHRHTYRSNLYHDQTRDHAYAHTNYHTDTCRDHAAHFDSGPVSYG